MACVVSTGRSIHNKEHAGYRIVDLIFESVHDVMMTFAHVSARKRMSM